MSQIVNKFLAQAPTNTLKGNNTGSTANVTDLTVAQVQTLLSIPTSSSPLGLTSGGTGASYASNAALFNGINPMTTTGDMIYESATGVASRLPIGSTNQVLTVIGGIPSWQPASGGNAITALTGDGTATGPGSVAFTLATVNSNVGSFGSSTAIPSFTVNGKGLITAASTNVVIAPAGTLSGTTLNSTVVSSSLTSLGTQAQALNMGSNLINNVTNPVNPQDAATKNYVDNLSNGLTWKNAVIVTSTSNITLSGEQTIDGVLTSASRVLVQGQTTGSQNGIYLSGSGAWTRTADAASGSSIAGAAVFVELGSINASTAWVQTTDPATVGTTALTFAKFSAGTSVTYGNGLQLVSNVVSVLNSNSSITVAAGGISVALNASASGLTNSSGLLVKTDGTTTTINASNQIEALASAQENLTLSSGDITNQFKDLAHPVSGNSAVSNSIVLSVVGGPIQLKGTDYTVSLTGGSAGVTRITFAGGLATGGNSALVSGDILMVSYSYLA